MNLQIMSADNLHRGGNAPIFRESWRIEGAKPTLGRNAASHAIVRLPVDIR